MASSYRLNRYNWLAQKLLVRHQYEDIIRLREQDAGHQQDSAELQRPSSSEHMTYAHGVALLRRGVRPDQVIDSLQQLSYDKNPRYFMLLCQCLMFAGHHDAVVALSRQLLNRHLAPSDSSADQIQLADSFELHTTKGLSSAGRLLLGDPRFWLTFGRCLEFQCQMDEAQAAFRLAARLATGHASHRSASQTDHHGHRCQRNDEPRCSFQEPSLKYAEFCIKRTADYKAAIQTLASARKLLPQNQAIDPRLALALCAQPTSSKSNMDTATELLQALDSLSSYHKNPAQSYNRLALRCRLRQTGSGQRLGLATANIPEAGLEELLIKAFVLINSLHQSIDVLMAGSAGDQSKLVAQIDRLASCLRSSDACCWQSASLWNNLGLCYLAKRKFIGALGCLIKAQQLAPTDWRINLNLASVFLHVGLASRALGCLLAARGFYMASSTRAADPKLEPLIPTLLAITYDKLDQLNLARSLHLDSIAQVRSSPANLPVLSLINYLIFLHRAPDQSGERQADELKLHILDQLEYCWLQRNSHDPQFSGYILDIARQIGEQTGSKTTKKTYAWTKVTTKRDQEKESEENSS